MPTVIPSRSSRSRSSRMRPGFYLPLALFSVSIIGGIIVLATELPAPLF